MAETTPNLPSDLQHLAVATEDLHLDPDNPNQHPPDNIDAIAASMEEFGQDQPIVARKADGVIIKGNGRFLAAQQLGWSHVAALLVDDDDLRALRRGLADHGAQRTSYLDEGVLLGLLQRSREQSDEEVPGFSDEFIETLASVVEDVTPDEIDKGPDVEHKAQSYATATIRQIVLFYDGEAYDRALERFKVLGEKLGAESHSDVVDKLMDYYEAHEGDL